MRWVEEIATGSNNGMMKTVNGKTVKRFNTPLKAGNP
nr:MAG TPA: hypothetical protein [Caudoviricetes sp.]